MKISPQPESRTRTRTDRHASRRFTELLTPGQTVKKRDRKPDEMGTPVPLSGYSLVSWQAPAVSKVAGNPGVSPGCGSVAESGFVKLTSRVVRAAQAASLATGADGMTVMFSGGWLQGVTCLVRVEGRSVFCRLKAFGAVARERLLTGKGSVGSGLAARGFVLRGYEVSR